MIPVLLPLGASVIVAIIADMLGSNNEDADQRSIEVCISECRAAWLKKDGVLQVYHQTTKLDCTQVVVEVTEKSNADIPGRVSGYPVLIKVLPSKDDPQSR